LVFVFFFYFRFIATICIWSKRRRSSSPTAARGAQGEAVGSGLEGTGQVPGGGDRRRRDRSSPGAGAELGPGPGRAGPHQGYISPPPALCGRPIHAGRGCFPSPPHGRKTCTGKPPVSEGVCVLLFLSRGVLAAGVKPPGARAGGWELLCLGGRPPRRGGGGCGVACPLRDPRRALSPSPEATLDSGSPGDAEREVQRVGARDPPGLPGFRLGHSPRQTGVGLCLSIASAPRG